MNIYTLEDPLEQALEIQLFKKQHYQDIFGARWREVYDVSPALAPEEQVLVAEIDGKLAGWLQFRFTSVYSMKFRGFAVLPEFRSRGVANKLLAMLTQCAEMGHQMMMSVGQKPLDIQQMYLTSQIYLDGDGDEEAFAFGRFLRKMGFEPHTYSKLELDSEELAAREIYAELHPDAADQLMVWRKAVVDNGVHLRWEAQEELRQLTSVQLAVVMHGLDVKLGNFERSGRVSYRYDLCPICAHMGSSEQDDSACKQCFIYVTCLKPFRKPGRFKEDYQISNAYFQAMRDFLRQHFKC